MNFDKGELGAFKNFITDRTSQSAGDGITAATMLMLKLGKSYWCTRHATFLCDVHASLNAVNGLLAVGLVGNLY